MGARAWCLCRAYWLHVNGTTIGCSGGVLAESGGHKDRAGRANTRTKKKLKSQFYIAGTPFIVHIHDTLT